MNASLAVVKIHMSNEKLWNLDKLTNMVLDQYMNGIFNLKKFYCLP